MVASVISTAAYAASSLARPVFEEVKKDFKAAEKFAAEEIKAVKCAFCGGIRAVQHWTHHVRSRAVFCHPFFCRYLIFYCVA